MSKSSSHYRSVKDTVRDLVNLAVVVNDRYHHEQRRGDADSARVLGGAKLLLLGMGTVLLPDQFAVTPPDDYLAGTLAVRYLVEPQPLHAPERKWAELRATPLLTRWLSL